MRYSDFSKSLLLHPGIVRIEPLNEDLMGKIKKMEYEHADEGVMLSDPVGLNEIFSKDVRMLLFCSIKFRMFTEPFMEIIDSRGTVVGRDVLFGTEKEHDCDD